MLDNSFVNEEISWGTMLEEDIIEKIEDFLEEFDPGKYATAMCSREDLDLQDPEDQAYYCWEVLFDLMNDIAPEGSYFGASEGDGSCFGFWEDPEFAQHDPDCQCNDCYYGADAAKWLFNPSEY